MTNLFWRIVCSRYRLRKRPCQARWGRISLPSCSCSDGNDFWSQGCSTWCPKRQDEDHTYISGSMEERIMMSSRCFAHPQQKTTRYIWIFRSSMKSMFQRIKRQGNRRILQADMAESPKVARAEILDSKQCWSETAIAPSFRLWLRQMSTRWKGNFIKFSIELYFGICSVLDAGVNPRRRSSNKAMTTK
jgi:hypothetical protein